MSENQSQSKLSLQEQYAPKNACFGCGPANKEGLRIQSFPKNGIVVASFEPEKKYEAFPGVLNGGIIGTLLDCHSNWTAAFALMQQAKETVPPCTVTAEYSIKLLRPTPSDTRLELSAEVLRFTDKSADTSNTSKRTSRSVVVAAKLMANGKVCATSEGLFVAVEAGHPGYYRW